MGAISIFIVEDDEWYSELLKFHLSMNPDYQIESFLNGKDLLDNLNRNPSIITLDYSLPDISGEVLLKKIKAYNPDLPVVIISGQEDIKTAINLLQEGAYDYIVKDDDTKDRLWYSINRIKETLELKKEVIQLRKEVRKKYDFEKQIIGQSTAMEKVFALLQKAAKTNITVSVTGETGTGKEMIAKSIHYGSQRSDQAFVAINVAAIPSELIESELFGHEKGAFTGASAKRIGKFEEANKGTIFLDEIGDMDANVQAKLLRVLQEREVTPIGGNKKIKIDTRVIVATHKNLAEEVKAGNFRSDLYYRLLGLPISLPPLRERGNDTLLLARFFLDHFCKDNGMEKITLSEQACHKLLKYPFPGNVRELKAVIELSAVMSDGETIKEEDISFNAIDTVNDILLEEKSLKEYNRMIISHFLDKYNQDVLLVAQKLDIGKSTIYNMKKNKEL